MHVDSPSSTAYSARILTAPVPRLRYAPHIVKMGVELRLLRRVAGAPVISGAGWLDRGKYLNSRFSKLV